MLNVKKLLTQILKQISTSYLSMDNTAVKNGSIYLWKTGRMVTFVCGGDLKPLQGNAYTNYLTLPTGWRPSSTYIFRVQNNALYNIVMYIQVDGTVRFYNYSGTISSATNGAFTGSFVTS